jgi:hypothetical protein
VTKGVDENCPSGIKTSHLSKDPHRGLQFHSSVKPGQGQEVIYNPIRVNPFLCNVHHNSSCTLLKRNLLKIITSHGYSSWFPLALLPTHQS